MNLKHKFCFLINRYIALGVLLGTGSLLLLPDPVATATGSNNLEQRARTIFQELVPFVVLPDLQAELIIRDSGMTGLAKAEPGRVVLSQQGIDYCYSLTSEEDGDACIAFIIGHELAHLSKHSTYLDLGMVPGEANGQGNAKFFQGLEHTADRWGFLYATMAGYRIEKLLNLNNTGKDIFAFFQEALNQDLKGAHHPDPVERTENIRTTFQELANKSDLFRFGTVASYFGDCETSRRLLTVLRREFNSPEIWINTAYCDLRDVMAELAALSPESDFCLRPLVGVQSTLMRPEIRRGGGTTRGGDDTGTTSLESILKKLPPIHKVFVDVTEQNPGHVTAWINKAITSFLAGHYSLAEHEIEKAQKLLNDETVVFSYLQTSIENPQLELLRNEVDGLVWLIKSYEHQADLSKAIEQLSRLTEQEHASIVSRFNLAKLLEKDQQSEQAAKQWKMVMEQAQGLPTHCSIDGPTRTKIYEGLDEYNVPYSLPMPLDVNNPEQFYRTIYFPDGRWADIKNELEKFSWSSHSVDTGDENNPSEISFLSHRDRASALRREHEITFMILRDQDDHDLGTIESLQQWCPEATPSPISLGEIWNCRGIWASWVVNGDIREVWIDLHSL
jgi:tetratricopeptide (TPR) repeat protein